MMFSSVPGLYPWNANRIPTPILWQSKISPDIAKCPLGRQVHLCLGTTELLSHTHCWWGLSFWLIPPIIGHVEHLRKEMQILQGIWERKGIWTSCSLFTGKRTCAFTLLKTKEDKYASPLHGKSSSDGSDFYNKLQAMPRTTRQPI